MNYVDMSNWGNISDNNYCFIELAPNNSKSQFDQLLAHFTDKHIKPVNPDYDLSLQHYRVHKTIPKIASTTLKTISHHVIVLNAD